MDIETYRLSMNHWDRLDDYQWLPDYTILAGLFQRQLHRDGYSKDIYLLLMIGRSELMDIVLWCNFGSYVTWRNERGRDSMSHPDSVKVAVRVRPFSLVGKKKSSLCFANFDV